MCGIAGIARSMPSGVSNQALLRMAAAIRHRGPDGFGYYSGARVGLAHVRLSIIDLAGGAQPMGNEDGRVLIVYNGEVYNYIELRDELRSAGHQFRTSCDTEVLVHAYEEWGAEMVHRLNGQFAFAIYDQRDESILLVRDRFGVRPLFYAIRDGTMVFGSEVKALFASGEVEAAPDLTGLNEVFTFWGAVAPRTPFRDVWSLQPGSYAIWKDGRLRTRKYYELLYPEARDEPAGAVEELDCLMRTGVNLRMRADVPVGGYLSGGLDSSITCALAAAASPHDLRTFSVSFEDPALDESAFQEVVARQVKSRHAVQHIGAHDIASVFPDVIRHTETPLVRTAPAPMYLLSRLTRERGIKVVLTGEGSDELFLGYDLFKETKIRHFCAAQPTSTVRPRLFDKLYPYLSQNRGGEFWRRFFLTAGDTTDPLFSHLPRIALTSRIKDLYSAEVKSVLADCDPLQDLRESLPAEFMQWTPVNRAAYLEMVTLLPSYLLSSQGDRMGMANSIEGRFPFLDHRLFEFSARLPTGSKLRGLSEKEILKRWAARVVPPIVLQRSKQPYRAPDVPAFVGASSPDYARDMLAPDAIARTGLFDPAAVAGLVRRCEAGRAVGFAENQAFVAVLSTQLWHHSFFKERGQQATLLPGRADVAIGEPAWAL